MKHSKSTETACLISGALLGAAAIYFLDPSAGAKRRRAIAAAAEAAYDEVHSVGARLAHLPQDARNLTHRLAEQGEHLRADAIAQAQGVAQGVQDHGSHLRDLGNQWWKRARDVGGKFVDRLSSRATNAHDDAARQLGGWRQWASHRAGDATQRAQAMVDDAASWAGYQKRSSPLLPVFTTAVGCFGVGAAVMYLYDPVRGAARRREAFCQLTDGVKSAGRAMRATGRDLAHRLRGIAYQGRSMAQHYVHPEEHIDSESLIKEIRNRVAQYTPNAEQVQFAADPDGTVTITGRLPDKHVHGLLSMLHEIPGVGHVINRLERMKEGESFSQPSEHVSS